MTQALRKTAAEIFKKLPKIPTDPDAKILHLTHDDLDGEGAAIVLGMLPCQIETKRITVNEMDRAIYEAVTGNDIHGYDFIIATDISCSEQSCRAIAEYQSIPYMNGKFMILDHHATSQYMNAYSFAVCFSGLITDSPLTDDYKLNYTVKDRELKFPHKDLHSSGTSLAMDYLLYNGMLKNIPWRKRKLMTVFVNAVRCYGTWDWKLCFDGYPDVQRCAGLSTLYDIYGANGFARKMAKNMHRTLSVPESDMDELFGFDLSDILYDDDCFVIECEKEKSEQFIEHMKSSIRTGILMVPEHNPATDTRHTEYSVAYVNCRRYLPEMFEMMRNELDDIDIYIINHGSGLSLRNGKSNADVGKIAALYGGGGHKGAAGIKIPESAMADDFISHKIMNGNLMIHENI